MKRYVDGVEMPVGQATMAESAPVVIASDQTPVPVSGSVTVSGPVDQGARGTQAWRVLVCDGTNVDLVGQRLMAASLPVVLASDQSAVPISAPVAAPAFVRLSDGAAAQGTSGNPLYVNTTSGSTSTVGFNRVNLDAFLRLRVSEPHTLFDSKFTTDNGPAFWDDVIASGAGTSSTYTQTLAQVSLGVSNLTAGSRVRQTFRRFNYQSGKSQLLMFTGVFGTPQAGITRRIGQFTATNGYIFEVGPASAAVVLRLNSVDNPFPQAAWNLDTFSGLGGANNPSGIGLDFSKNQILVINYEWLGVGSVWFGFVVGGMLYWAHRFDHSNLTVGVYSGTPNLPLRYEITNDGTGAAASLVQICSTVISEGGRVATGLPRAADRGATPLSMSVAGVLYPVFNLRIAPDATIPGASGSLVEILSWDIVPTGNDPLLWRVLLNPTFAGVALAWTTATQSAVQFATPTNATTVTAGTGVQIEGGYISSSARGGGALAASLGSDFALGTYYNGTPQILSIVTRRLVGAVDVYSSASWRETS